MPDFSDPFPEHLLVVLVERSTVRKTEWLIESCEACNKEGVEIPFDWILDVLPAPIRA